MCRDYDKKRVEQEQNKASESNGELKSYCAKCRTSKPMDKFVMPNGNSYNKCRRCLRYEIYDSDEDDNSSSYNYQCEYNASDYEAGFSNM